MHGIYRISEKQRDKTTVSYLQFTLVSFAINITLTVYQFNLVTDSIKEIKYKILKPITH